MSILDDTRTDWRARRPTGSLTVVAHARRVGRVWHWNGPALHLFGQPHAKCLEAVRSMQVFHQDVRGWNDHGYNALICPHARAIEGRGLDKAGAHSPSWNTARYGIQLMVGQGEKATPAMLARAARLAQDLEALAGHDLDDKPHRDDPKVSTACPGDQVTAWVRAAGPETKTPTTTRKDPLMDHATFKALVREVLAERETARQLFTAHDVMIDPATGKRAAPSKVIERAATPEVKK